MKEPMNEELVDLLDKQISKSKVYTDEINNDKAQMIKKVFIRDAYNLLI